MSGGNAECIKVALRCRPMSSREQADGYEEIVFVDTSAGEVTIRNPQNAKEPPLMFTFDFAFDKKSTQKSIFEKSAKGIVEFVIKGYNGTIFAYGQTGTGKTHTMQGGVSEAEHGITPRSFKRIFDVIRESEKTKYLVSASMFELYNEEVNDLLNIEGKNLKIKENPDKGFYIQDLDSKMVTNENDLNRILEMGSKNRKTSCTDMNDRSSRSHCIFVVNVDSQTVTVDGNEYITSGKLNLVDLAGSEKQNKTNITSAQQKAEAIKINLSLSTLRKCIHELVTQKKDGGHVPFRDSNLTRLLKDSLGGNTKTFMIANIGPASYNRDESVSTLKYAYSAKSIKNKPKINEDPKDTMIRQFTDQLENLRMQLAALASGNTTDIDPKALMALMGTSSDDKMGQMIDKRQKELERQREDLEEKRRAIDELKQTRIKNGENAEKVEKEIFAMESEINKQEVAIDEENHQKAKLLDELSVLEERMVVGDKEKQTVEAKRQELESFKKNIQNDIAAFEALEKIHKEKQEHKDAHEKKVKDLQGQIGTIDREINQKNMELTKIKAEIQNFEEIAASDKEKLLKEMSFLNSELTKHQRIVKALIPHSVESLLTSIVEWNERTQNWDMVKNQKINPRYERPFSVHGLKKPTLSYAGVRPEYQNCFIRTQKGGVEFWRDRQPETEAVLKGDNYLESQLMQMNPDELDVNTIETSELDQLEKEVQERDQREADEANRKAMEKDHHEEEQNAKKKASSTDDNSRVSKTTAATSTKTAKVAEEELFPEARGKKARRGL